MVFAQSALVGCFFIPLNYATGGFVLSLYGISFVSTSLGCLFILRHEKWQMEARLLFITVANLMIYGMSKNVGEGSDIHFFYGPAVSLPFLMFPKGQVKALSYSIGLPFGLMMAHYFVDASMLQFVFLSESEIRAYGFLSSSAAIVMVSFGFYFLYQMTLEHEESLVRQSATLIHSEKMSSLGHMAAGIAHEVNNPLSIITGTAELMRRKFNSSSIAPEPGQLAYLDRIVTTALRISRIVESLKVYSRDSSSDGNEIVDISTVITQAFVLSEKMAGEIRLESSVQDGVRGLGNTTELLQSILNLINNSVDAIEKSPESWVQIRAIKGSLSGKPSVQIQVIDSGLGIRPEILKHLFTPFYTTKPVGLGTGLGLSLSQKLIESRGGRVYYSLIDGHTAFVVELIEAPGNI